AGIEVAEFGDVLGAGLGHIDKPVPRLRVHVHVADRFAPDFVFVDADDEMLVDGGSVVLLELFAGQVPVSIEPAGVAGRQEKAFGAIGFRQFTRFGRGKTSLMDGSRAEGITLAGAAGTASSFVTLEQNGRDFGLRPGSWFGFAGCRFS